MEFVSLKSLSVMPLIYTNSPKSFDSSEPMNIHEPAELIGSPSCIIALDWSEPLGARPDPGERGEPRRQRRASRPHAPTAPLDGREPSRPGPGPEGIAPGADGSAGTALRRSGATPAADTAAPAARCPLPAGVPPVLGLAPARARLFTRGRMGRWEPSAGDRGSPRSARRAIELSTQTSACVSRERGGTWEILPRKPAMNPKLLCWIIRKCR